MADKKQKNFPYPLIEFLQELIDLIVGWAYETFALKSDAEPYTDTADNSAAASEALMSAAEMEAEK